MIHYPVKIQTVNTTWGELPLTVQGRRQPMDNLVRQLHEAGFLARRIRDFCTGASEKELCIENPDDDSYANRVRKHPTPF